MLVLELLLELALLELALLELALLELALLELALEFSGEFLDFAFA